VPPQELDQKFAHASSRAYQSLWLRHVAPLSFYVEQGLPQTPVLLWVSGEELRAVFDTVVLAEYHCHYDLRPWQSDGHSRRSLCSNAFCSPQGALLPSILRNVRGVIAPSPGAPACIALSSPTIVALYTRKDGRRVVGEETGREACGGA